MSATLQSTGSRFAKRKFETNVPAAGDTRSSMRFDFDSGRLQRIQSSQKSFVKVQPFLWKAAEQRHKEAKEGIIRLELSDESVMSAILEFIYTGSVQTLATREMAENLVFMADYLFLPK